MEIQASVKTAREAYFNKYPDDDIRTDTRPPQQSTAQPSLPVPAPNAQPAVTPPSSISGQAAPQADGKKGHLDIKNGEYKFTGWTTSGDIQGFQYGDRGPVRLMPQRIAVSGTGPRGEFEFILRRTDKGQYDLVGSNSGGSRADGKNAVNEGVIAEALAGFVHEATPGALSKVSTNKVPGDENHLVGWTKPTTPATPQPPAHMPAAAAQPPAPPSAGNPPPATARPSAPPPPAKPPPATAQPKVRVAIRRYQDGFWLGIGLPDHEHPSSKPSNFAMEIRQFTELDQPTKPIRYAVLMNERLPSESEAQNESTTHGFSIIRISDNGDGTWQRLMEWNGGAHVPDQLGDPSKGGPIYVGELVESADKLAKGSKMFRVPLSSLFEPPSAAKPSPAAVRPPAPPPAAKPPPAAVQPPALPPAAKPRPSQAVKPASAPPAMQPHVTRPPPGHVDHGGGTHARGQGHRRPLPSADGMHGVAGQHGNVGWEAHGPIHRHAYTYKHEGHEIRREFYRPGQLEARAWGPHNPNQYNEYVQRFDERGKAFPIQKKNIFGVESDVPPDEYRSAVRAMRDARRAFNWQMKHPPAHAAEAHSGWPAPASHGGGILPGFSPTPPPWLPGVVSGQHSPMGSVYSGGPHQYAQGRPSYYGHLKVAGSEGLPRGAEVLGRPPPGSTFVQRNPTGDNHSWFYVYDPRTGKEVGARYHSDPGFVDPKGNFYPIVPPQDRAFRDHKPGDNKPHGGDPRTSRGLDATDGSGNDRLDRRLDSKQGLTTGPQ